jgi:predicted glycosyltransferase
MSPSEITSTEIFCKIEAQEAKTDGLGQFSVEARTTIESVEALRAYISEAFSSDLAVDWWNLSPLPEVIRAFVEANIEESTLESRRFACVSGSPMPGGPYRGMLWADLGGRERKAVFAAVTTVGLRRQNLQLYLSHSLTRRLLPPQFLSALHQWLRTHDMARIARMQIHGSQGESLNLDPTVAGVGATRPRRASIAPPRILIFTHDGRGLGHLRRLARLGSVLQRHASVLFITGHREASWIVPRECEYIHLPSLDSLDPRRSRQWGRVPFLRCTNSLTAGRALRRDIIASAIERFDPDAMILDYLPLGMDEEMREFVRASPQRRNYFIARGLLGDPIHIRRDIFTQSAIESLEENYHMILAMTDQKIIDMAEEYALEPQLAEKLVYVGYAAEPVTAQEREAIRAERGIESGSKWVVCGAGGGKEGEALVQRCWEIAQIFPECTFDIVAGPRSRLLLRSDVRSDEGRIRLHSSEDRRLPLMHAAADVVISRGGYNSLMEACVGDARILVAPIMTDFEQVHHAQRLSAFREIDLVESLEDLDLALHQCLMRSGPVVHRLSEINMDGLHLAAGVILSDLEQHRAAAASTSEAANEVVECA